MRRLLETMSQTEWFRIEKLLKKKKAIKIEPFEHYSIYLVDQQTMEELLSRRERFADELRIEGIVPPYKEPFYYVAKLINPKVIAVKYKIAREKKYVYVKDPDSILANIDKKFAIWENVQRKNLRKLCEERKRELTTDFCQKLQRDLEQRIAIAKEKKEAIKEDPGSFELLWTTYKHARHYPIVIYKVKDGNYEVAHLRKTVPNILQYEEEPPKTTRRDMLVEQFIAQAEEIFDDFFVKPANKNLDPLEK